MIYKKWTVGATCHTDVLSVFRVCKQLIEKRKAAGEWTEEDEAAFQEQSLDRLDALSAKLKRRMAIGDLATSLLSNMCIAEQLAPGERRDAHIEAAIEQLNGIKLEGASAAGSLQAFALLTERLLASEAEIGPRTAEQVDALCDRIFAGKGEQEVLEMNLLVQMQQSLLFNAMKRDSDAEVRKRLS